jgi:redox-sensing transcriptional repressor
MLIVGMGNLGSALSQYLGFNYGAFRVVAGVDRDPAKIGRDMGPFVVRSPDDLPEVVRESGAEIGVLAVPAEAAQENYDRLAEAGIKAVLNFAPVRLKRRPGVQLKNVDLRINLEELAFFLR